MSDAYWRALTSNPLKEKAKMKTNDDYKKLYLNERKRNKEFQSQISALVREVERLEKELARSEQYVEALEDEAADNF
jgi:hypothetical protein